MSMHDRDWYAEWQRDKARQRPGKPSRLPLPGRPRRAWLAPALLAAASLALTVLAWVNFDLSKFTR